MVMRHQGASITRRRREPPEPDEEPDLLRRYLAQIASTPLSTAEEEVEPGAIHLPVAGCGARAKWPMNHSRASSATASRAPGSSNRWVAPGTTASRFSQRSRA